MVLNSAQSMEQANLATRKLSIEVASESDHVAIHVRDRGPGIPPDLQVKVFEQFFTTKPMGMGLRLAVFRTFIHAHRSSLDFESFEAETTFRVQLPRVAEQMRSKAS